MSHYDTSPIFLHTFAESVNYMFLNIKFLIVFTKKIYIFVTNYKSKLKSKLKH